MARSRSVFNMMLCVLDRSCGESIPSRAAKSYLSPPDGGLTHNGLPQFSAKRGSHSRSILAGREVLYGSNLPFAQAAYPVHEVASGAKPVSRCSLIALPGRIRGLGPRISDGDSVRRWPSQPDL